MENGEGTALVRRKSPPWAFNATRHGLRSTSDLVPGESAVSLGKLLGTLRSKYKPQGPTEQLLVATIGDAWWRLARVSAIEAGLFVHVGTDAQEWHERWHKNEAIN